MLTKTLLGSLIFSLEKVLQRNGRDSAELFEEAGLYPDGNFDSSSRIPASRLRSILTLAAEKTEDPCFGLEVGRMAQPMAFHALGYSVMASSTLKETTEKIMRLH